MQVIFDLDGVLLDSESNLDWLDRALSSALRALDLPDTEENCRRLYPGSITAFEEHADDLGVDAEELWAVRHEHYLREKVGAIEEGEIGPFPDVAELAALRPDHDLHIISNSPQPVVDTFLEEVEPGLFEVAVGRGTDLAAAARMKPDPHLYEVFRERAGRTGDVYVGDRDSDAAFAENVGLRFVRVDREETDLRAVRERLDEETVV